MRVRYMFLGFLSLLLLASILVTAQTGTDPSPQCAVIGRGADGPAGEIQCRENALAKAPGRSAQVPAMLFRLAETYQTLGEVKAEEYYKKLVADHCKVAPDLCAQAQKRLAALQAKSNAPRRIDTPFTSDPYSFAISPDGQKLVYLATVGGKTALWLHDLKSGKAGPIPGTESNGYAGPMGGAHPFWSPDSKAIGFFVDGKLKRIDAVGGVAETISDAPYNYGGSWNRDGVIIFVRQNMNAVYQVAATGGGVPQRITQPDSDESHRFPQFLPDGRHFLFYRVHLRGPAVAAGGLLAVGSLDSPEVKALSPSLQAVQAARIAPQHYLLTVAQRALFAQHLDHMSLDLTGSQTLLAERVADFRATATPGYAAVSVSEAGPLAYRAKDTATAQLVWFDRQGRQLGRLGPPDESASVAPPRLSPNSRTVAVASLQSDGAFMRLIDAIDGSTRSLFVADIARFRWDTVVWSGDGESLFFGIAPPTGGNSDLYRRPIAGSTLERITTSSNNEKIPADVSPDGNYLLYTFGTTAYRVSNLLAMPLSGGPTIRIAEDATYPAGGRFSPDGRWVAFQQPGPTAASTPNNDQILIRSFGPNSAIPARISFNGRNAEWSRDGRELYFISPDNRLMAAPVKLPTDSGNVGFGEPVSLFTLPEGSAYTSAPDGRFLVNVPLESASPIYILSDWTRSIPPAPASNSPLTTGVRSVNRAATQEIAVFDRRGNSIAKVGVPYSGASGSVTISPDGTRIATILDGELSVTDISSKAITRLATDAIWAPAWSGDGRRLAYISDGVVAPGIYIRASNGGNAGELIYRGDGSGKATSLWNWSIDGRFIGATIAGNLAVLPAAVGLRSFPIISATGRTGLRISPHGDVVAYLSNETGSNQVFIRSFDPNELSGYTQRQITKNGAAGMIRWSADGEELYYLARDGAVMVVPITRSPLLKADEPSVLFHAPPGFVLDAAVSDAIADVSGDGQRFVFVVPVEPNTPR